MIECRNGNLVSASYDQTIRVWTFDTKASESKAGIAHIHDDWDLALYTDEHNRDWVKRLELSKKYKDQIALSQFVNCPADHVHWI